MIPLVLSLSLHTPPIPTHINPYHPQSQILNSVGKKKKEMFYALFLKAKKQREKRTVCLLTGSNFLSSNGSTLGHLGVGLGTHDTTTPVTTDILPLLGEVGVDSRDNGSQLSLIGLRDFGQSKSSGSLLVDECTETSLTLDNTVRDTHLTAESREPENQLNGVNIISNDDQLGLLGLNQSGNVVDTVLDDNGLVSLGNFLLLRLGKSSGTETLTLLSLGLGSVLVHQLEDLSSSVLVQNVGELVKSRRDLKTLVDDLLLTLKLDILRPLDETRDITLGLNILTDTKVLGGLFDQRVGSSLGGLLTLDGIGRRSNLLTSGLLGRSLAQRQG